MYIYSVLHATWMLIFEVAIVEIKLKSSSWQSAVYFFRNWRMYILFFIQVVRRKAAQKIYVVIFFVDFAAGKENGIPTPIKINLTEMPSEIGTSSWWWWWFRWRFLYKKRKKWFGFCARLWWNYHIHTKTT